jgi:hypothetical protein
MCTQRIQSLRFESYKVKFACRTWLRRVGGATFPGNQTSVSLRAGGSATSGKRTKLVGYIFKLETYIHSHWIYRGDYCMHLTFLKLKGSKLTQRMLCKQIYHKACAKLSRKTKRIWTTLYTKNVQKIPFEFILCNKKHYLHKITGMYITLSTRKIAANHLSS